MVYPNYSAQPGQVYANVHRALQELWMGVLMLYRMAFTVSGKVVSLHLDNSIAEAYIFNQIKEV